MIATKMTSRPVPGSGEAVHMKDTSGSRRRRKKQVRIVDSESSYTDSIRESDRDQRRIAKSLSPSKVWNPFTPLVLLKLLKCLITSYSAARLHFIPLVLVHIVRSTI